ncbi:MAG: NifB/NifX family molybdenum-iron cluster-binding protein [Candidatus Nanopelagicales bacterium]
MLIAVSAVGPTLEHPTDPAFGRCQFLLYVDPTTMEYEATPNPGAQAVGGAGIQAAQAVAGRKVQAVVTGNVGPNAMKVLDSAGVEVFTGCRGTAREAIELCISGQLHRASSTTVQGHPGHGAGGMR